MYTSFPLITYTPMGRVVGGHQMFHTFPFELHAEIGWAGLDTGFRKWRGGPDKC